MDEIFNPENLAYLESQAAITQSEAVHIPAVDAQNDKRAAQDKIQKLKDAIRMLRETGYLSASFNPLEDTQTPLLKKHTFEGLGFTGGDRRQIYPTFGLLEEELAPLDTIISHLHSVYTSRIGIEYEEFVSPEIALWIQDRFERLGGRAPIGKEQKKAIYQFLAQAELFEIFLHTKHVGQKRFSLEGVETIIPMLIFLLERACQYQVETMVLGMAHRGRLNVLANVMMKPLAHLFAEFEDRLVTALDAGDVKYHKGYTGIGRTISDKIIPVVMVSNPSHLESVDGVVEGFCRGLQQARKDYHRDKIVPLLIHGDASIAGQGVIYETLQLSNLDGYDTGGTIHLIINNQVGFTTNPEASRSTRYCTDIAKSFGFPIFHVNAEDPEMCVWAMISAFELRQKFHVDVFVEVNGYRKHGHNESDEPAFTQPLMYERIHKKKSIKTLYQEMLCQEGIAPDELLQLDNEYREKLAIGFEEKKHFAGHIIDAAPTLVPLMPIDPAMVKGLIARLYTVPEQFTLHPRVLKAISERPQLLQNDQAVTIDWSFAEAIAFATILQAGIPIRLTGQDAGRGTFSQRHAVWIDQKTGKMHVPLKALQLALFEVIDSPLSEYAVLAFEYGYSIAYPQAFVIWEAQFGDFANNAQVIIDQYIASGEKKWGNSSSMTLLLPHGYEGQGPEHSSARIERFLLLAAEENMVLAVPTTPAQYFHLLRFQATRKKPLVIFTPKALLRHPECRSSFRDLSSSFQAVLFDPSAETTSRVLICQGKVYYELLAAIHKQGARDIAIMRIEQLYPFPEKAIRDLLPIAERYVFVQEEPENAGAYLWLKDRLAALLPTGKKLEQVHRKESATPAIGSHKIHEEELQALLGAIFYES